MSVNTSEFAFEFVEKRKFFEKIGFELIGTQELNKQTIFLVKPKKD